jgi:hypothetical protein
VSVHVHKETYTDRKEDADRQTHRLTYLDDLEQLGVGLGASAVGVDVEGEGLGDTDGIGNLHDAPLGEASSHEGLGNPAGSVCRRPVRHSCQQRQSPHSVQE